MKKPPFLRFCTSFELFLELKKICDAFNKDKPEKSQIILGFDELHLPDKAWLSCALFILNPESDFFTPGKKAIRKELLDQLSKE